MDTLFTTEILKNGKPQTFTVSFHDERYIFKAIEGNESFSIRREDDEWHSQDALDEATKTAVTEKLEAYLLSQH